MDNTQQEQSYSRIYCCSFCQNVWIGFGSHCPECGEPRDNVSIDDMV